MSKYIDVKVTIWGRLHFKDDTDLNKLIELLKQGNTTNDLCDEELGFSDYEILYDTEEELSLKEQYWIGYYNSYENGYNATRGGDGSLYRFSETDLDLINCSIVISPIISL